MDFNVTLLPGDGVGAEVTDSAVAVLNAIERKFGHNFHMRTMPIGGAALDMTGVPLPKETRDACAASDAVLLGAVGGSKWSDLKPHMRPEKGVASLKAHMRLFANMRPIVLDEDFIQHSPIRPELLKKGVNIMLVREDAGGIYATTERGYRDGALGQEAFDTEVYSISEVERIAEFAFEIAAARGAKLTSVDKSSALSSGMLWRATAERVAKNYPSVAFESMQIDECLAALVKSPSDFQVILAPSMFGEFIASTASAAVGNQGTQPTCTLGAGNIGLYSPVHGPMQDIAGKDEVNPIATVRAAAMMLSTSLKLVAEAVAIENAVKKVLAKGLRTKDIATGLKRPISCSRMTEELVYAII